MGGDTFIWVKNMKTREALYSDLEAWVGLRHSLWPKSNHADLLNEAKAILKSKNEVCFLLIHPSRGSVGFSEAALHSSSKGFYCHVEGWYVMPEFRGHGHGKELIECIESWTLHRSINLLTSDTIEDYPMSPEAHARAGFKIIQKITIFAKELRQPE